MCIVAYKLITKMLVSRLQVVLDEVILPYQNAFIKGHQIFDHINLVIEQLQYMRKCESKKTFCVAVIIDFRKAYDFISCHL